MVNNAKRTKLKLKKIILRHSLESMITLAKTVIWCFRNDVQYRDTVAVDELCNIF